MNDQPDRVSIAVQAQSPAGRARAKQVWNYQKAMARMSRAVHSGMRAGFWAAWIIALAEAAALFKLVPLVRVVPVLIPVSSENTLSAKSYPMHVDPGITLSSLKNSPETIQSVLWQYVRWRESYSWADANYAWDVVSAMSTVGVRKEFQEWYVYTNKQSPQVVYGFKGALKVSWADARLKDDRYSVTFWRQRFEEGAPVSKPELWVCDLVYAFDYSTPLNERLQFNAGGLVVASYPGCYPQGARPGGIAQGGGVP